MKEIITAFFEQNSVVVYFVYGLAFFAMGLAVWLESGRASEFRIARAMVFLAGFGIVHGLHEWFEMFQHLGRSQVTSLPDWLLVDELCIGHMVLSFFLLIVFGVRLVYTSHRDDNQDLFFAFLAAGSLLFLWWVSAHLSLRLYTPDRQAYLDSLHVLARYILGIPGALLAAWAILLEQRTFRARGMPDFGRYLLWAALALLLYGLVGQAFPRQSYLFPANILNEGLFQEVFAVPVQFVRALLAIVMALFIIRALRAFEVESRQRLAAANEARLAAQRQAFQTEERARQETEQLNVELQKALQELQAREALRGELLQQIVDAQENERKRIARELHDGTGQILTGMGLGFAAAANSVKSDPALAGRQLSELQALSSQALEELRNIICDLRPSVLDDIGLVAALRGQVVNTMARTGIETRLVVSGERRRLHPDIETVIFRIAQEALTNVTKHAQATSAVVRVDFETDAINLTVEDNGCGFLPEEQLSSDVGGRRAWGLLGIQERVSLAGGSCDIRSTPGKGTCIEVRVPLASSRIAEQQREETVYA